MNELSLMYAMGLFFNNLEFVAIGSSFISCGPNYISFPQGSKTSFLYLIEGSDNNHGSSIGFAYESLIMSSTHPLLQFKNSSGFLHIWEAIFSTYPEGDLSAKLSVKSSILFRI